MKNHLHNFIMISMVLVFTISATQALVENSKDQTYQWSFGTTYEVGIMNGFVNSELPLQVHCQSKDNDLGNHTLHNGQGVSWKFKVKWDGSTRFYCDVEWNNVQKHFDAFNAMDKTLSCLIGNCYWLVSEAGFYLSTDHFTWVPRLKWDA